MPGAARNIAYFPAQRVPIPPPIGTLIDQLNASTQAQALVGPLTTADKALGRLPVDVSPTAIQLHGLHDRAAIAINLGNPKLVTQMVERAACAMLGELLRAVRSGRMSATHPLIAGLDLTTARALVRVGLDSALRCAAGDPQRNVALIPAPQPGAHTMAEDTPGTKAGTETNEPEAPKDETPAAPPAADAPSEAAAGEDAPAEAPATEG